MAPRPRLAILSLTVAVAGLLVGSRGGSGAEPRGATKSLVYVGQRAEKPHPTVFSMNVDGSEVKPLGSGEWPEVDPALSPDGKLVAYARFSVAADASQLYVMNADGANARKLTSLGGRVFAPAWSPDGTQIAFCRTEDHQDAQPVAELLVTGLDGAKPRLLGAGAFPSWSHDGKRLTYSAFTGKGKETQLKVMNADGTGSRVLIEAPSAMGVWSSDGKRLAYLGFPMGDLPRLYVGNADGTRGVLADKAGSAVEVGPVWSPDSRKLYFTRLQPNGQVAAIYASSLDGKPAKRLTPPNMLAWLGNGGWFLLTAAVGDPPR